MVAGLIAQVGIPVLIETIKGALERVDNPVAKGASEALSQLDDAVKRGKISPEQLQEANRHIEKLAGMEAEERQNTISQINDSLRAEVASSDPYVRRMRPTFGYLIAITWAAQMLALAWVIIYETESASIVIEAMESLGTIWAVGLSVLGIYVYKRSEDKKIPKIVENEGIMKKELELSTRNMVSNIIKRKEYND
ncbi:MAG: ribokinase [Alphaproteobacteria bacterium]|nr:ribokinase [Alphaproteobacteria bacterium]|tara:strand:- start:130 stop:714 length:585 start_codon:yes stop_codon:yes gene_type:complete